LVRKASLVLSAFGESRVNLDQLACVALLEPLDLLVPLVCVAKLVLLVCRASKAPQE